MKVTQSNLHYVAYLLRNVLSDGFIIQSFYPEAKRFNSILKHFKIKEDWKDFLYKIEQSIECSFEKGIIEIESDYIRIHNGIYSNSDSDFFDDPYKVTLIHVGDEITFNKGLIKIRASFVLHDAKCIDKITY